jgi:hypothetical protein
VIARKAGLVGLVGLVGALGVAVPGFAGGNKYDAVTDSRDCGSGDTVALNGPLKLWPPNHKFVPEPVTAADSDPTSQVSLTITPTLTDAAGGDGGAQHQLETPSADVTTSKRSVLSIVPSSFEDPAPIANSGTSAPVWLPDR